MRLQYNQPEETVPEKPPLTSEAVWGPPAVVDHTNDPQFARYKSMEKPSNNGEGPWRPDPHVVEMLGLEGETAQEIAVTLEAPTPDLNDALQELLTAGEVIDAEVVDPHLIPLEEQRTEAEEEAQETASIYLPNDPDRPWSDWQGPEATTGPLHSFQVEVAADDGLLLRQKDGMVGYVSEDAFIALGRRITYPPEFVRKLQSSDPVLAAAVVNDRILAADDETLTMLVESGEWVAATPAHRGLLSYRQACDVAYNTLRALYADTEVASAWREDGLCLRLLTPVEYPVTEAEEDTLQMGIEVRHNYTAAVSVALYLRHRRTGGALVAWPQTFSWRTRTEDGTSTDRQAEWLRQAIALVIGGYTAFVENARKLASTPPPMKAWGETMGIPKRFQTQIAQTCDKHKDSIWGLLEGVMGEVQDSEIGLKEKELDEIQAALGGFIASYEG